MAKKQDLKITRRKPETGRGGGSGKKETFPVSEESSVSPAETGEPVALPGEKAEAPSSLFEGFLSPCCWLRRFWRRGSQSGKTGINWRLKRCSTGLI